MAPLRSHPAAGRGLLIRRTRDRPRRATAGWRRPRGPLVLFLDDDVVPAPDLVSTHVRHHHGLDDDVVVVGPMRTPDDLALSPWVQWEQRMLYKQYDAMLRGDWKATARQFYTAQRIPRSPALRVRRWVRSRVPARRGRRAGLPAGRRRAHLHLRARCRGAALCRALVRLLAGQRRPLTGATTSSSVATKAKAGCSTPSAASSTIGTDWSDS